MPIYEYDCPDCRRRVNLFFRSFRQAEQAAAQQATGGSRCPYCQGTQLHRRVSRVALLRSEESRLDDFADDSLLGGLEAEDPHAMAGMMRKMEQELGEPLDPEMNEVIGRMEAGESMEAIEAAMPALSGDPGTADDFAPLPG